MSKYGFNGWKNKGGTSDRTAPGGSWKNYWLSQTDQDWPNKCCVEGCNNEATDGAHMFYPEAGKDEFIIPTCHQCNMQYGATFNLKKTMPKKLVSANVSKNNK